MISFDEFYRCIYGVAPFPWQAQAAERLARREAFAVAIPTGLGKSAMVDAAIWAAANGSWRRIAFVVDRRIVVDAVHQRATRIAEKLGQSSEPGLRALADRLGEMQVVRLRGGVFGDDDWVLFPERLTVILTTVDQLGSRLLFRGYGVTPRRWPMHAGFVSSDTLIVVDEAHLSTPFLQTLSTLREHGANITVVPMSATLAEGSSLEALKLQPEDLALPVVEQRLSARKPAALVDGGANEAEFLQIAVAGVQDLMQNPSASRVALVVNRVATARKCFARLQAEGVPCVLLTGRVRPVDRDGQLAELLPQVEAGRIRRQDDPPLVVVATQTIEVGADFDFDALVTECASMSALRQRFGRLDRLGELGQSSGMIVRRPAKDRDDPVYGTALAEAWEWLQARADDASGMVDFGLTAMDALLTEHPPPAEPLRHAASLLPVHLEMLSQTGPYVPEFDLGSWLHGPSDRAPDVTLVWRDDLAPDAAEDWPQAVLLLPPMLREGLPLPCAVVRRWLTGAKPGDQWGDDGGAADDGSSGVDVSRQVLRWRGPDDCQVIVASEIRPGDTLVLPATYGGCDTWGWAPDSTATVADLADQCLAERIEASASRRVVLRLVDGHWGAFGAGAKALEAQVRLILALEVEAATSENDLQDQIAEARQDLIAMVQGSGHRLAARLRDARIDHHSRGLVVRGTGTEDIEGAIETGRAVGLQVHHADVARWSELLAGGHAQVTEIVNAARVHDAGKAEPRMQALLHGNPLTAAAGPVLAKSALRRREEQVAAWKMSGLPRGFRHEFASLDYETIDDQLTRYLVATHHGYGRPWLVACQDEQAAGARFARLDTHWARTWSSLLAERGPWALVNMEWLLRAADARASIEEAEAGDRGADDQR